MLARFTQVHVSAATARRLTEVVGRASAAVPHAAVARLRDEWPPGPEGPDQAVVSVEGALGRWGAGAPAGGAGRVGPGGGRGEWAAVKTLVVGPVEEPVAPASRGQGSSPVQPRSAPFSPEGRTTAWSSCARLADGEPCTDAVLGDRPRRGVERAGPEAAVSDGAEWI